MASADTLLHPIRLRIVKALLGDRALTTTELAKELDDVPQASLYRHISRLLRDGVLQVVAEQRIRGAVERTYALHSVAAQMHANEIVAMSPEDHAHAFTAYIAGALSDFDRYMATNPTDPVKDGAGYRLAAMWLSDAEYNEFLQALAAVVQPRLANAPKQNRRRRLLYGIALPDATAEPEAKRTAAPGKADGEPPPGQ